MAEVPDPPLTAVSTPSLRPDLPALRPEFPRLAPPVPTVAPGVRDVAHGVPGPCARSSPACARSSRVCARSSEPLRSEFRESWRVSAAVLRPSGATDCSHGWRSPAATGTRGPDRDCPSRPGGAAERPTRGSGFHTDPGCASAAPSLLRPSGAGLDSQPVSTGCAAGLRPCAAPVATRRSPSGAERSADMWGHPDEPNHPDQKYVATAGGGG